MKRMMIIAVLAVVAGISVWALEKQGGAISLTGAQAVPVHDQAGLYIVSVTIENNGPATTLLHVQSPSVGAVSVINPDIADMPIVVPAQSSGFLAMDGAHITLTVPFQAFEEGAFIPLTLTFEGTGDVSTRVINAGMGAMVHGALDGVSATPPPTVALRASDGTSGAQFKVQLAVENFTFAKPPDGAAHKSNEGPAHIYLNGLKLGRLYAPEFTIGAPGVGDYNLRVTPHSNDHWPYVSESKPVSSVLNFSVPN